MSRQDAKNAKQGDIQKSKYLAVLASWRLIFLSQLLLAGGVAAAQESPLPPMPTIPLRVGDRTIHAEVVSDEAHRSRGLMHRKDLAPAAGMLFVFPADDRTRVCMWMRDTSIALSAAFIDAGGRIIKLVDMQPRSEKVHCADETARFVLEARQGVFAAAGVKPGSRIGGLPVSR